MFARFDENPAMTLQDIKETKRYGRTDALTDGQRENSIPTTNKVCRGYKNYKRHQLETSLVDLFVCIVALCPKSTAMVMAGRSVHLTTLFLGQA